MPTRIRFETGVLADAVKKAARVAPSRGGAEMDRAAGIVFDVDPGGEVKCTIRATDTVIYYMEALSVVEATGDSVRWRLASGPLATILANLPARGQGTITMETDPEGMRVQVTCGRMKARLNLNVSRDYPTLPVSDDSTFVEVVNLGESIQKVDWCAAKAGPPLNGVYLDGNWLCATDRFRMSRIPFKVDLKEPVVIPASAIGSVLANLGAVKVGVDGSMFVVQPDDFTQIKTVTIAERFPANIYRRFDEVYEATVTFDRRDLVERIQSAVSLSGADRDPVIDLHIGAEQIAIVLENAEVGKFGDLIEISGQAIHDRILLRFAPKQILDAMTHSPTDTITLYYRTSDVKLPVVIKSDAGYEAIVAPRAEVVKDP